MTNREITTLMHRLFGSDLGPLDYVHLIVDDQLDRTQVDVLLDRCIPGDELMIFVNSKHVAFSKRDEAFEYIRDFMRQGRVKIADPKFHGRVIIEPLGVGAGRALTSHSSGTPNGAP